MGAIIAINEDACLWLSSGSLEMLLDVMADQLEYISPELADSMESARRGGYYGLFWTLCLARTCNLCMRQSSGDLTP